MALFVAAPSQQPMAASQETALLQLGNLSAKPVIAGAHTLTYTHPLPLFVFVSYCLHLCLTLSLVALCDVVCIEMGHVGWGIGVVCQGSLLEAKGVLPNLAAEWAGSLAGLLAVKDYQEVAPSEPVVVSK